MSMGLRKSRIKGCSSASEARNAVTPFLPALSFLGELHVRCQSPEHHLPFSLMKYLLKKPEFPSPQLYVYQQLMQHGNSCYILW